jgi:hypothetical protein
VVPQLLLLFAIPISRLLFFSIVKPYSGDIFALCVWALAYYQSRNFGYFKHCLCHTEHNHLVLTLNLCSGGWTSLYYLAFQKRAVKTG